MLNESKVGIVIEARDRATGQLRKVERSLGSIQKRMVNMRPTFQRMAVMGTAAFSALAVGVGFAVKQAGLAEGAYNKFNAVFKESSEDMLAFVDDLRHVMPTARSEIVRMAADLQDLLVPMGLSRELSMEMTKGFLTLSNQLAAFNDVDPTRVLEAMKSALVGSSEPLKRFGIDARITTLEAVALEAGLLGVGEKFADLTPQVRAQITAQALLKKSILDSSDAIAGFGVNQDSFLRRFQEMQATLTEVKEEIGTVFLPMMDDMLKAMLPIIKSTVVWIKENPKLTKVIILSAGALAGLVAVLGIIGLILPSVIGGIGLLSKALIFLRSTTILTAFSLNALRFVPAIASFLALASAIMVVVSALNLFIDTQKREKSEQALADIAERATDVLGAERVSEILGEEGRAILNGDSADVKKVDRQQGYRSFNFDFRGATVIDADSFVKKVSEGLSRSLNLAGQGI